MHWKTMGADDDLRRCIDRLESLDEIRQLPAEYSLALDMRDSHAWANLFPEDIRVGGGHPLPKSRVRT